ncbi:ABC-type transport auxiliary lipoprotein family protein [Roseibacterium sp. SDUM158017]|uniref:ABC-type transport auxiliary lipoprotein family protein n=1 Tax=Roseicyclus salinarum TaxID=3036773 RepID=UPI0024155C10|nr:ABC-type transport auxiliary lipoprotein family protein [Roseibacterium sp. SDUM158017]MDG4648519.1 ABC-type transport auxiliary lipoprotein family protein [Roseibacterium sp. SDUM158017]
MTPARMVRAATVAAVLPMLASCSAISALGDAATPLEVIVLETPGDLPVRPGRPLRRDIIVEEPSTGGALATDRILIQPGPFQAQYLPGVRWSAPAPQVVQTLMLRALDATEAFQYVGRQPLGPGGDFAIVTELVDFQAVLGPEGETARVEVRMVARIVRERGVEIVASRTFAANAVAASLSDLDLAAAFDDAAGRVISDFALWTLSSLGAL